MESRVLIRHEIERLPLRGVHHVQPLGNVLIAVVGPELDLVVPGTTASGLDHDHAVRRLRSVLRRGRRVLEDLDRLDVVRIEVRILSEIHPVDDVQRRGATESVLTSDDDLRRTSRFAR